MVKRRMNYFMLRIGMDDLLQRAFPEDVPSPDATKPLPDEEMDWALGLTGSGYDDRSLFWPLEYRGRLRVRVLAYASERWAAILDRLRHHDALVFPHAL